MNINDITKIVLISDTHMRLSDSAIEAVFGAYSQDQIYESQFFEEDEDLKNQFMAIKDQLDHEKPKIILHAGDIGYQNIINALEQCAPVVAVNGNCDFQTFQTINGQTEKYMFLDVDGVKIAMTHIPYDLENYSKTECANLRVHGHTHESYISKISDNVVSICPGSATMGRYGTPNSIACVYIYKERIISADLIEV